MQNWLDLGNWNAICDSCGRKFKANTMRKRWDGLIVCQEDYEIKHPQLSLRVRGDKQIVPWVRPEADPDVFLAFCTLENSQGIVDLAVVDCARVDYRSPVFLDPPPIYINNYPAIAGLAVAGYSVSGIAHTEQPR